MPLLIESEWQSTSALMLFVLYCTVHGLPWQTRVKVDLTEIYVNSCKFYLCVPNLNGTLSTLNLMFKAGVNHNNDENEILKQNISHILIHMYSVLTQLFLPFPQPCQARNFNQFNYKFRWTKW